MPASPAAALPNDPPLPELIREAITFAAAQYRRMLDQLSEPIAFPRTWANGKLTLAKAADWTSGFFPGSLWYLGEATADDSWNTAARRYTAGLESMKHNRRTHDIGFMLQCSFGNGYRLTADSHYRDVLLAGAESLAARFNPTVGCIKSWDTRAEWPFPVIIDNMMNLELLLWASRTVGDPQFRRIAESHADVTLRHHFRPDGSTYHVVDYDPATGAVRKRQTHQGAADESAWARGQAWAVYGYTLMFRETGHASYRDQAQKTAEFILRHPRMPADAVPYWDFDAPASPPPPRDASAAAVMSSALFELSGFVGEVDAARYRTFALAQLRSLASAAYRAPLGENGCFLLLHSTGSFPRRSEVDAPLNYADYYFLEALLRASRFSG